MDVVLRAPPAVHPVLRAEHSGQCDGAVKRHPAHDLGVQKVLRGAADLPDALVFLGPSPRGRVGDGNEELPGGRIKLADLVPQSADGRQQLAVAVDLPLGPCSVADAHRGAAPPAVQMGEHPLGQVALAAHAEDDLQVRTTAKGGGRSGAEEGEESGRLVRAGSHPQGIHGETGVTDPGVAVVPVAAAAGGLRQRGRRRRHDRAGRVVGQGLEYPAARMDQFPPRPGVRLVNVRPGPPAGDGVLQPPDQLVLGPDARHRTARLAVVQPEREPFAGRYAEAADHRSRAGRQACWRGQDRDVGAAAPFDAPADRAQERRDKPVLGSGHVLQLQLDPAGEALYLSQQQAGGTAAERMTPVARTEGQGVDDRDRAGGRGEGRLQHHRLVEIATADLEVP